MTFDHSICYIVAKNPNLSNIIVKLGGFHLLMSYMSWVGYKMARSGGLKEVLTVLSTIYAPITVDKILTCHAYSKAVRRLTLVYLALSNIILHSLVIRDEEKKQINDMLSNFNYNPIEFNKICDENVMIIDSYI